MMFQRHKEIDEASDGGGTLLPVADCVLPQSGRAGRPQHSCPDPIGALQSEEARESQTGFRGFSLSGISVRCFAAERSPCRWLHSGCFCGIEAGRIAADSVAHQGRQPNAATLGISSAILASGNVANVHHYIEFGAKQLHDYARKVLGEEHIRTDLDPNHSGGRLSGTTEWRVLIESGWVELSWRWMEMPPGIVVLSDPNSIASNIRVVGEGADVADFGAYALQMNLLVRAVDWQSMVCAEILRQRVGGRDLKRMD